MSDTLTIRPYLPWDEAAVVGVGSRSPRQGHLFIEGDGAVGMHRRLHLEVATQNLPARGSYSHLGVEEGTDAELIELELVR